MTALLDLAILVVCTGQPNSNSQPGSNPDPKVAKSHEFESKS